MALTLTKAHVSALPGALVPPGSIAGEELELGEAVYLAADGKWYLGRANVAATSHSRGIVVSVNDPSGGTSAPTGKVIDVCTFGRVAGYSGMTPGKILWQSAATAGAITETQPSGAATWSHSVGYAEADDIVMVMPGVLAPTSNS